MILLQRTVTGRYIQYPGHYTALIANTVDHTEPSRRKKGASMTLKIVKWKHMGQGDGGKKGVEKRERVILVWNQAAIKKFIFTWVKSEMSETWSWDYKNQFVCHKERTKCGRWQQIITEEKKRTKCTGNADFAQC